MSIHSGGEPHRFEDENWSPTLPPRPSQIKLNQKDWNWRRHDEITPATYYEASLREFTRYPALSSDHSCDVVVIGAGLLGASTALHLAEAGLHTILVDASCVGSGASGRNGGQLTSGLARWKAEEMLDRLDRETAERLWRFTSCEAMSLLDDLISRYAIHADRQQFGHLTCCIHPGHLHALEHSVNARKSLNDYSCEIVSQKALEQFVKSELYFGALHDKSGGQIHPLALNRGLVNAFEKKGGTIFEQTPVIRMGDDSGRSFVYTPSGCIEAKRAVVVAAHHRTPVLLPNKRDTTLPFHTYIGVTEPLPVPIAHLLPGDMPVYDTQIQIDYYRAVRENRLLFGGQGTGSCWSIEKILPYLTKRVRTVFPVLSKVEFDFLWAGTSDITVNGAVSCRKEEKRLPTYFIHGWSGHGVAQTIRIGKAVADDFVGKSNCLDLLLSIKHRNYPGLSRVGGVLIPVMKAGLALKQKISPESLISF